MDLNNKQKWETFLSSIDTQTFKCLPTNKLAITTKRKTVGLATEFANKLFRNKGGTVELRATPEVLNLYRHLHVPDIPDVIIEDETLTHIEYSPAISRSFYTMLISFFPEITIIRLHQRQELTWTNPAVLGLFQTLQNISVLTIASPDLICRLALPLTRKTSMKWC